VEVHWKDRVFFERIPEFITGQETPGPRWIARTDPEVREGIYLVTRLSRIWRRDPRALSIELAWIPAGGIESRSLAFPLPPAGERQPGLFIGLTGEEAPPSSARPDLPVWRLRLLDEEGSTLAERVSWLWVERDGIPSPWKNGADAGE
jgi:hypothetical protein